MGIYFDKKLRAKLDTACAECAGVAETLALMRSMGFPDQAQEAENEMMGRAALIAREADDGHDPAAGSGMVNGETR